jgi:hypothetical protein
MLLLSAMLSVMIPVAAAERPALLVAAPDSPVRLDHAAVLTASQGPPVVLYAATNVTDNELEQFTVIAFVFDADGTLKARQTAPGRRTLEAHAAKFSTIVLDGSEIKATDLIVIGVNQAQRAGSEAWWRGDLQAAATAAAAAAVHKK